MISTEYQGWVSLNNSMWPPSWFAVTAPPARKSTLPSPAWCFCKIFIAYANQTTIWSFDISVTVLCSVDSSFVVRTNGKRRRFSLLEFKAVGKSVAIFYFALGCLVGKLKSTKWHRHF